jgi:diaminopimelate epimerase
MRRLDNPAMRVRFTKMQGAGNDFVVLDATREPLALDAARLKTLADRRFGVGADQILVVERASRPDADFRYRIFNGGNGDGSSSAATARAASSASSASAASPTRRRSSSRP